MIIAAEKRSWMTIMFLYPFEVLNGPMKSIAIHSHGRQGLGMVLAGPAGLVVGCLFRWQVHRSDSILSHRRTSEANRRSFSVWSSSCPFRRAQVACELL